MIAGPTPKNGQLTSAGHEASHGCSEGEANRYFPLVVCQVVDPVVMYGMSSARVVTVTVLHLTLGASARNANAARTMPASDRGRTLNVLDSEERMQLNTS